MVGATSCMITPGEGDMIGYIRAEPVQFSGLTTSPGSLIRIEANHPHRGWEILRYTTSSSSSLVFDGVTFYPWHTEQIIPLGYWSYSDEEFRASKNEYEMEAEVRAVDLARAAPLYTFEGGFYEWFDSSQSLYDMYQEHGAGVSVTIFGYDFN